MGRMYSVLIVDDEKYIRRSIIKRIHWEECETQVIGEAEDGETACQMIREDSPDIVMTDIRMPGMDGLMLAKWISQEYPSIQVIIVSAYNEFEYARKAVRYGVRDYLLKPVVEEELKEVLLRMVTGLKKEQAAVRIPEPVQEPVQRADRNQRYDVLEEIRDYVRQHYKEDISVAQIAENYHMNAAYLSSVFKERNNIALSNYIEEIRMEKAKKFLREDWGNITETARAVGYGDSNYFTKVFKKYTGMTPSQWRKAR